MYYNHQSEELKFSNTELKKPCIAGFSMDTILYTAVVKSDLEFLS
jgi:hypothetical protein